MLILGALVLLAQADLTESTRGPCQTVQVSSPQQDTARAVFSASEVLDLKLSTRVRRGLEGAHVLQIKVFTPRGYAYQTLTVPFTVPRPGTQGPLPELVATLPVAGTAIVANSLYGRWTVQPFLDGASCGSPRAFTLRQ